MRSLFLTALLATAGVASAQGCGALAITGSGAPGTSLQLAVSGAQAGDIALLLVGQTLGATNVPLPMGGNLSLGLDAPFVSVPIGRADAGGAAALTLPIPAMLGQHIDLHGQAVLLGISFMPFGLRACATNVVDFGIG